MKIALDRLAAPHTTYTFGPGCQVACAGFEIAGGVSATLEVHLAEHGVVVVNGDYGWLRSCNSAIDVWENLI